MEFTVSGSAKAQVQFSGVDKEDLEPHMIRAMIGVRVPN